ncbi:MAG: Bax inhibitor-1/YccA family protein [Candidatus Dependentiae bacterium]
MFQEFGYAQEKAHANFMYKVYGWMCAALAVTSVTAFYVASSPTFFFYVMQKPWLLWVIFAAQLVLVVVLSSMLHKMNYATAVALFMVYAISIGITMSLILRIYTLSSIASTFIVTSGMFGGMSLYGYFTKTDLTTVRNIVTMILWGVILSLIVNMFLQSVWFDYAISMVGVVIFALLTAADTQKIKALSQQLMADVETKNKIAILGALMLYLDFINLFLFLLRFTGNRRK